MKSRLHALGFALCLTAAGPAAAPGPVSYAYDAYAPLELSVDVVRDEPGVRISEIAFRSGASTVRAALVVPQHPHAAMPGVVFVHWLGDVPATTNHTEFLEDAKWLARRGIVSVLPDAPWSQPRWFETIRSTATDPKDAVAEVIAIRRAFDVLVHTSGVDGRRLAFVGHDFGAMYGALVAGADARPTSFVFITPTTTFAEWFLLDTHRPPSDPAEYAARMKAFDIPASLSRATFGAALLQFAAHDPYVPRAKANEFAAAVVAREKTVRTYEADHALAVAAATDERRAWLAEQLKE